MLIYRMIVPVLAVFVSSCDYDPQIRSASSSEISENSTQISVDIGSDVASELKKRQYYFSIVVDECDGGSKEFPVEAYVGTEKASNFTFPVAGDVATFTGTIPAKVFASYRRPCAYLRGGGYTSGKIKSNSVQIIRR